MPRVSVVIPAYRSRRFIEEAVDSVLDQTFTDFEVIVVDDGCPEGTGDLVESRYVGGGAGTGRAAGRVRVIRQENRGPGAARNAGIESSTGEWVAFLDADDRWEPRKLEVQLAFAERHPGYALLSSSYYKDEGGRHFERKRHGPSGWVFRQVFMANYIRTSTVMIRRECFETVGLFDASLPLTQDYDMWLRVSRRFQVGYIEEPLATYRHHPGGISRKVLASREYFLRILTKNDDPEVIPRRLYRKRISYIHFHIAKYCRGEELAARAREHLREAVRLRPASLTFWCAYLRALCRRGGG